VQRVVKFVKYLPQFGWEPIIFTVANGEYPAMDYSLEEEIDPSVKVYKVKTLEIYHLYRKLTGKRKSEKIETYELLKSKARLSIKNKFAQYVRMNFLIPDARMGWHLTGVSKAMKIIPTIGPFQTFQTLVIK